MNRGAEWGRLMLLTVSIVAPVAAVAAFACVRWGRFALEAVQVVLKMAVIP